MPDNDPLSTVGADTADLPANSLPLGRMSGPSPPGLDLRSYELLEQLGVGGMGEVYRASDPALGRDLAVKIMKGDHCGDLEAESRFLREAHITGSLQHPGIVPVHNLGRLVDGRLHYTMRLVRGQTFAALLKQDAGKPERVSALLAILEKVCQAVAYAHSKRVLHRDLKPSNVMVGRFGEVQVMDWGLAKRLDIDKDSAEAAPNEISTLGRLPSPETPWDLSQTGRGMGTPAYMPPEQARGEWDTVDERADVFALGAMLCTILTGQPPYLNRDTTDVLIQAGRGDVTEALERLQNCGADTALVELCRACLASERDQRPRDAEAVAQRLALYLAQVQERLRRAELDRAAAQVKAQEERKRRRWRRIAVLLLVAGAVLSSTLAFWAIRTNKQLKASESRAQARLELVNKSNGVLASIFQDLDPRVENKDSPSLRVQLCRRMEKAAAQLEELADSEDPATVARLQSVLGCSLNEMGEIQRGIELLSKAGATLESCLGPDDKTTLDVLSDLALAYEDADQMDKALALYEQILARSKAKLGPNDPETLSRQYNVAKAYWITGRLDKAVPLWEQTLTQRKKLIGVDHKHTLFTMNGLALAYKDVGRDEEALPLLEYAFTKVKEKYGFNQQDTLTIANNLANAYRNIGELDKALPIYQLILDRRKDMLGPDHPKTLNSINSLAIAYWAAAEVKKALPLLEQNLIERQKKLGDKHRDTLKSMHNLGSIYLAEGRFDKALPLLEATVEKSKAKLGADHPDTLTSMSKLAEAYKKAERPDEALSLFEQTLALQRVKLSPDHPDTMKTLSHLAEVYLEAGKLQRAGKLSREGLALQEKKQPNDWRTFLMRSLLGEVLLGRKKYSDAEPLLVQGYKGMKEREARIPPDEKSRLIEAQRRLARLDQARGKQTPR